MMKKETSQQIKLQDGRMLGYDEHGSPDGKPVIYIHGFPSSRLDWLAFDPDDAAAEHNARIIAVDRRVWVSLILDLAERSWIGLMT